MTLSRSAFVVSLLLSLAARGVEAEPSTSCGQNAALRYWMAFAQMENPPAAGDVAKRLGNVAEGKEPWDESLAGIVDANRDALATMHRGSRLAFCDWGLEHEQLAEAPIAYVPRARALARLNVMHGKRLLHQGRAAEAVDAWLAGMRFSRDVSADGVWLSALVAAGSLKAHLHALTTAAGEGRLDPVARKKIEREVAALREDGFDWSVAAQHESEGMSAMAEMVEGSAEPVGTLKAYFPSTHEIARLLSLKPAQLSDVDAVRAALRRARAANDALRPKLLAAFQEPHDGSLDAVREIDAEIARDPALSRLLPSVARFHEERGEVVRARAELLAARRGR